MTFANMRSAFNKYIGIKNQMFMFVIPYLIPVNIFYNKSQEY